MDQQPEVGEPVAPNPRPLPVLVLADVSGSMAQDGKIETLNQCISTMIRIFAAEDTTQAEITVGVITFGGHGAALHQPLTPASDASWTDMVASGHTPLHEAFELVVEILNDDDVVPRRAFLPTLVLVSDGMPTNEHGMPTDRWKAPLDQLIESRRGGRAVRLAVGVGQDMDDEANAVLKAFVANPAIRVFRADEVDQLPAFFSQVTYSVTTRVRSGRADDPAVMGPEDLLDFMG